MVNEHEPLLLTDFEALLEGSRRATSRYRHDDQPVRTVNLDARANARTVTHTAGRCCWDPRPASTSSNGRLLLGRWQRVFLVELDGPRAREISVLLIGEAAQ